MKNTFLKYMASVAVGVGMIVTAQATPFTGGISMFGDYSPDNHDLTLANKITISDAYVGLGAGARAGTFLAVAPGAVVSMWSPLFVDPAVVPAGYLWTVPAGADTFYFKLNNLVTHDVSASSLTVYGQGWLTSKSGTYGPTMGSYVLTLNSLGGTFTFSSSNGALPDGGTTAILLGAALSGLALLRRKLA